MSSCKCFDAKPRFKNAHTFEERITLSSCTCRARFSASENNSKFTIQSGDTSEVEKIKIDGCLESSSEIRKCDYLFIFQPQQTTQTDPLYIFVELKGKDIEHAVTQIGSTIDIFLENGYLRNNKVIGAIVNSRNPSHDGSYRRAKLKLENKLSSKIKNFRIEKACKAMIYDPINDKVVK